MPPRVGTHPALCLYECSENRHCTDVGQRRVDESDRKPTDGVLLRASEDRAMEYFINIANVLFLMSYFVRDMLLLRILSVTATSCLLPYFYFREDPIMTVIYWNSFFITLNLFWVVRLSLERRAQCKVGETDETNSAAGSASGSTRRADQIALLDRHALYNAKPA